MTYPGLEKQISIYTKSINPVNLLPVVFSGRLPTRRGFLFPCSDRRQPWHIFEAQDPPLETHRLLGSDPDNKKSGDEWHFIMNDSVIEL